jgi:hypothetical protein
MCGTVHRYVPYVCRTKVARRMSFSGKGSQTETGNHVAYLYWNSITSGSHLLALSSSFCLHHLDEIHRRWPQAYSRCFGTHVSEVSGAVGLWVMGHGEMGGSDDEEGVERGWRAEVVMYIPGCIHTSLLL